jgi:hypothetical protein
MPWLNRTRVARFQSLRRLRGQPMFVPDSLLAQLDLFKILQETGYHNNNSDNESIGSNDPISFVSVPDLTRLGHGARRPALGKGAGARTSSSIAGNSSRLSGQQSICRPVVEGCGSLELPR